MLLSASFLQIQNQTNKIKKINNLVDQIHFDIMDGIFVPNKTIDFEDMKEISNYITKPKDFHFMVKDIYKYVDMYKELNPNYIIFHYESTKNIEETIDYLLAKEMISKNIDVKTNIMILILNVFFGRQCQDHMNWNDMILKE